MCNMQKEIHTEKRETEDMQPGLQDGKTAQVFCRILPENKPAGRKNVRRMWKEVYAKKEKWEILHAGMPGHEPEKT